MWRIEIIDTEKGEFPGKIRQTLYSKLPVLDSLNKLGQSAVMTRIPFVNGPKFNNPLLARRELNKVRLLRCIGQQQKLRLINF